MFLAGVVLGFVGCQNRSESQWSAPELLSSGLSGEPLEVGVAIDSSGNPHVVWAQSLNYVGDEIYYTHAQGSVWYPPMNVSQTLTPSHAPLIHIDNRGNQHLFWSEERIGIPTRRPRPSDVFWRLRQDSTWRLAEGIFHQDTARSFPRPSVICDSPGTLFLAMQTPRWESAFNDLGLIIRRNGIWQTPRIFRPLFMPSIARERGGTLWIAFIWGIVDSIVPYDHNSVFAMFSTNSGQTWSDSILISRSGLKPAFYPKMIIDSFGRRHIVWFQSLRDNDLNPWALYHSSSEDGIVWQQAENITRGMEAIFREFDCEADRAGRLHLIARGDTLEGTVARLYYFVHSNNRWSQPERIPVVTGTPIKIDLEIGSADNLHLVWSVWDSTSRGVYYSKRNITLSAPVDNTPLPKSYSLSPSFPNPFNPSTHIQFELPEVSFVSLNVYDVLGRKVAALLEGVREAGRHTAVWSAEARASGVYFARFTASDVNGTLRYSKANKLLLAK